MKLGDFPVVETLADSRALLVRLRDQGHVRIHIDDWKQNVAMCEAALPAIKAELQRRIDEIDQQLHDLGVDVG